ncbi:FHA domain-containing protein [Cryobacterium sp. TMT2-18-3]|uniref:FHA domain-containing protein n=1 Tax=unclassified Cryobacterium TaxID=2649013 RepID=UPI00106C7B28|nr:MULTISPECIES: FHA domain-containing protein [unclassified Cryobacterium]TFC24882.1 FHA domain-containing protein [Cryobacterium sp. TMT2-18-2]TFC38647.1 FHA domain-containing protein [Cryobacterium sp. TMT2-42-4]TFC60684.1 FHA domain-containing protein [Cryobacterium sp. TMT2-18-3]
MNCLICGAQLPVGAMFCGECGSSSTATPLTRKRPDPRPSDTTVILPLRRRSVISVPVVSVPVVSVPVVVPVVSAPVEFPVVSAPVDVPADIPVVAVPVEASAPVPLQAPEPAAVPLQAPEPAAAPSASLFVLQFSTGETISALGTGLIGRRPLPQPTERVDILVQINDLGRSVSKSHLEFGQHDGEFWVSDRFSGNGTIIRRPDAVAVRCEPGRRYLVPRGSRIEIADQFFILN